MKRFNKVRKPKHLEFYTIYEGEDGVKRIHIFGYCYKADDHWANMECNHFTDTVKEFVANIKADANYVDNTYQILNQYQGDHSPQEMADIINRYFDGKPADRYLAYGDITEDTPCGDYVCEWCKPRTPAESLRSPEEVLDTIVNDWKVCGYSYAAAAEKLGYADRQSLSTFFYRKRKKNAYMTMKQTTKFKRAFGYNPMFLMNGVGELKSPNVTNTTNHDNTDGERLYKFTDDQLLLLLQIASSIISYSNDEKMREAWESILAKNLDKYHLDMKYLIERSTGKFIAGQDLLFLAERLCL